MDCVASKMVYSSPEDPHYVVCEALQMSPENQDYYRANDIHHRKNKMSEVLFVLSCRL